MDDLFPYCLCHADLYPYNLSPDDPDRDHCVVKDIQMVLIEARAAIPGIKINLHSKMLTICKQTFYLYALLKVGSAHEGISLSVMHVLDSSP